MTKQERRGSLGLRRMVRCGFPLVVAGIGLAATVALAVADPPQEVFIKAYGQLNINDVANRVIVTSDGRIVITGYRQSSSKDLLVAWFDATGTLLRKRAFGGRGDEEGLDLVETSDGDILVVGYTRSKGDAADFLICRISGTGSTWRWTRYWGNAQGRDEGLTAAVRASDGSIWATGYTDSFTPVGRRKVVIARLDSAGTSLACCRAGKLTDSWDLTGTALTEVFNTHGFCVAGTVVDNALLGFGQQILLAKFSDTPDLQWARRFDGTDTVSSANSIIRTSDACLALAGNLTYWDGIYSDAGCFVLKTDANADLDWARWAVGFAQYESLSIYDLIQTQDGRLLTVGRSWDFFSPVPETVWLAKMNLSGAMQWGKGFDATPGMVARGVAEESTGHLLLAGSMTATDEYTDVMLARCTSTGQTCRTSEIGAGFSNWSVEQNEIFLLSSAALMPTSLPGRTPSSAPPGARQPSVRRTFAPSARTARLNS